MKNPVKTTIALAAICGVLAAPAMAQSLGQKAQSLGEKTGVNAVVGVSPTTDDFIKEVAISDMFEIQSSMLATERGNAETKTFAAQMVADHQKTTGELKTAVMGANLGEAMPTGLDSSHQSMLDKLKGLNGAEFDRRYRSDQVSAHKDAVSLFQRYANGGDQPALRTWAATTLPALQHHLDMAQKLDN